MTPAAQLAALKAEVANLTAYADTLKGALAAYGCDTFERLGPWAETLSTQERAFIGALFHAYPRAMSHADLLDCLPGHDHAVERQIGLVAVKVHHVRKKLGNDAIITDRGRGFSLGPRLHALIATPTAKEAA